LWFELDHDAALDGHASLFSVGGGAAESSDHS
jgi:hypothetical protein